MQSWPLNCSICRNKADAELHATVAEHASDCKQQLSSSTANVEAMLSNISDDNVMQLEETDVHKVQHYFVPCLICSPDMSFSLPISMHGATTAATNTLQLCLLTTQLSLHCQRKKDPSSKDAFVDCRCGRTCCNRCLRELRLYPSWVSLLRCKSTIQHQGSWLTCLCLLIPHL